MLGRNGEWCYWVLPESLLPGLQSGDSKGEPAQPRGSEWPLPPLTDHCPSCLIFSPWELLSHAVCPFLCSFTLVGAGVNYAHLVYFSQKLDSLLQFEGFYISRYLRSCKDIQFFKKILANLINILIGIFYLCKSYKLLVEEYSCNTFKPCPLYLLCPGVLVTMKKWDVSAKKRSLTTKR